MHHLVICYFTIPSCEAKRQSSSGHFQLTSVWPASVRTCQVTAGQVTETQAEGFGSVWMNAGRSPHPSVAGAELPLASHHSSLVAVGSLHFPWQVLDLCLQLGLLVLKLDRMEDMENQPTAEGDDIKWKSLGPISQRSERVIVSVNRKDQFLPVSCEAQIPCNTRKDTYTAACSDTENTKQTHSHDTGQAEISLEKTVKIIVK